MTLTSCFKRPKLLIQKEKVDITLEASKTIYNISMVADFLLSLQGMQFPVLMDRKKTYVLKKTKTKIHLV